MRLLGLAICGVLVGCAPPAGPGRFTHSAIQRTIAPWDGHAVQLFLSEEPLAEKKTASGVLVQIYKPASELPGRRFYVDNKDRQLGGVLWRGKDETKVAWADVTFEKATEGEPATGTYEVAFADGSRARGRFEAPWWKAEGRGG